MNLLIQQEYVQDMVTTIFHKTEQREDKKLLKYKTMNTTKDNVKPVVLKECCFNIYIYIYIYIYMIESIN